MCLVAPLPRTNSHLFAPTRYSNQFLYAKRREGVGYVGYADDMMLSKEGESILRLYIAG